MAQFSRSASLDWSGSIMEGKGTVAAATGAFSVPVAFPKRIGEPEGITSPEELMAAAHATCFGMVLAGMLGRNNATTTRTRVTCTVTADKGDAGIKIQSSKLVVEAEGLTGMDAAAFDAKVKDADKGCPVSNAYRPTMAIEIETKVS